MLDYAHQTHRLALESRARLNLARIDIEQRAYADALTGLRAIPADGDQMLGPEMQAQVHYWRSRALKARGDSQAAQSEAETARRLIVDLRDSLPAENRDGFASRPDIVLVTE